MWWRLLRGDLVRPTSEWTLGNSWAAETLIRGAGSASTVRFATAVAVVGREVLVHGVDSPLNFGDGIVQPAATIDHAPVCSAAQSRQAGAQHEPPHQEVGHRLVKPRAELPDRAKL